MNEFRHQLSWRLTACLAELLLPVCWDPSRDVSGPNVLPKCREISWRRASTHLHILIYAIYMYNIHMIKSHSAIFCSRVSCLKHLQIPALSSRSKRFKSLELKWSEHASPMASPYASCRHLATPPSGLAFWSQPWFRWTIHRLFGKFGEKSEQASRTQIRLKKPG